MKLKSLLPEKKEPHMVEGNAIPMTIVEFGYNQAREEDGEIEVELDLEKIKEILRGHATSFPDKVAQAIADNLHSLIRRKK